MKKIRFLDFILPIVFLFHSEYENLRYSVYIHLQSLVYFFTAYNIYFYLLVYKSCLFPFGNHFRIWIWISFGKLLLLGVGNLHLLQDHTGLVCEFF